jgi:hypothetical protein
LWADIQARLLLARCDGKESKTQKKRKEGKESKTQKKRKEKGQALWRDALRFRFLT